MPAAAQPKTATPEAPPQLEKLDEGEPPAITISKPDTESKISEKRENGKVTGIKVKSGNSTYFLKPSQPAGSSLPGDVQSGPLRGAQWQIFEFEAGPKKKNEDKEDDTTTPSLPEQPKVAPPSSPTPVK